MPDLPLPPNPRRPSIFAIRRGIVVGLVTLALALTVAGVASFPSIGSCAPAQLHGRVVAIADGDTLTLLTGTLQTKVRLWGIDCPEKRQAFGQVAKTALSNLTFGKDVAVESRGTDRYGRTLGWIVSNGQVVNLELVKTGMAWWYKQYAPKATDLAAAEQKARAAKVGLWADPDPIPPWEFRHNKRGR